MNILLVGFYGDVNYGDEAILFTLSHLLRRVARTNGKKCTVYATSASGRGQLQGAVPLSYYDGFQYQHRVRPILSQVRHLARRIRKMDLVAIGGGGVLHDMKHRLSMYYYLLPLYVTALLGKPTALIAVAIDVPLHSRVNRFMVRTLFDLADFVSVRDVLSRDYLQVLGVQRPVALVADPVLAIDRMANTGRSSSLTQNGRIRIGVNIRRWGHQGEEYQRLIARGLDALIRQESREIIFLCSRDDTPYATQVRSYMRHAERSSIQDCAARPLQEVLDTLSELDAIISMRLHFLITAAVINKPAFGISYLPKVSTFCDASGIPWVEQVALTPGTLANALTKANEHWQAHPNEWNNKRGESIERLERFVRMWIESRGNRATLRTRLVAFSMIMLTIMMIAVQRVGRIRLRFSQDLW